MKLWSISLIGCLVVFSGCATAPKLSPMQIRSMTTKAVEGSYDTVFRATLTVLQDQGYIIKNTDMNSGLIVANVDRESPMGSQILQAAFYGSVYNKGTLIEVSAMINKNSETSSDIRLNIQETTYSQWGGKQNIRQIYEPEVYNNLFNEIVVEAQRRQAINKS